MSWVLERSPTAGAARLVLLVLANHADPDGRSAWPAVPRIASQARCSTSSVHRVLRKLEREGHVVRDGKGPHGTVNYRLAMERGPTIGPVRSSDPSDGERQGVRSCDSGGPTIGPKPSRNRPEPSGRRARARGPSSNGVYGYDDERLDEVSA